MDVIRVDDPADPRLADFRGLTDVAMRRLLEPAGGLYLAESAKVISRALAAGHQPRAVLLTEAWLADLEQFLADHDVPVYVGEPTLLEQVMGFEMHRGALASMHRPALPDASELLSTARRVLVLEDLVDHTNVGAAFRAAAGLGADAVLVTPSCADPLYRRSVRVSMGTVLQIPWTRTAAWPETVDALHSARFTIVALALEDDAVDLADFAASPPDRVALLLGAEGDGLSRRALTGADVVVTIPMAYGVDSLNVASAAAVAMWALQPRT